MYDTLLNAAEWLRDKQFSQFIQSDENFFPALEVLHVMAVALVIGPILLLDFRLMDVGGDRAFSTPRLMRLVVPIALGAFVVAFISGGLMFASQPTRYIQTPVFLIKMGLLVLAGANMMLFHRWFDRTEFDWHSDAISPARARIAGLTSMLLWLSILVAGRFIGFVLAF
jgi:hypothetical protein